MAIAAVAAPFVAGAAGASMLTVAGLALGAVGAVSGNKGLALAGSLIGLAGGFLGGGGLAGSEGAVIGGGESVAPVTGAEVGTKAATTGTEAATSGVLETSMNPQNIIQGGGPTGITVSESGAVVGAPPPSGGAGGIIDGAMSSAASPTPGVDFGGDTVLSHPQIERAVIGDVTASANKGLVDRVLDWAKGNPTLAHGVVTTAGRMLQAGFSEDPQAERVKVRNAIELEELQRKTQNMAGVASIKPLNIVRSGVSPFRTNPYQSPAVGIVGRRLS
jgi:hypothetical protein